MNCNKNNGGCNKSGIRIHESNNDPKTFDLDIENYSINDLFRLFGIKSQSLTDDIMKESKKIVLKMHPDKSGLEPTYFLFFSKAYKRLYGIYEFQNKSTAKSVSNYTSDFSNAEYAALLNTHVQKDPREFNKWFNEKFDKYNVTDDANGYGDWLKSDEGIYDVGSVSKSNMASEFEKQKKRVQAITVYNGVSDYLSGFRGSGLGSGPDNYTSDGYTDLRQAYVESVIPVTNDDFAVKYKNVDDFKRQQTNMTPPDRETATKILLEQDARNEQESAALAFHYAQQTERAIKQNKSFWSELKQLNN